MMSSEEETESLSCSPHDKLLKKSKRTRQRVDAGEPRNSYASIPNFCSRPLLQLPCSNGVLSPPNTTTTNNNNNSSSSSSNSTTAAQSAKMLNELLGRQLKCDLDMGSDSTVDSTDVKMNGQGGATTPNGGGGGGAVVGGNGGGGASANGTVSDNASTGSGIGVGGSLVGLLCPDSPPDCVDRSQLLREILQGKNKADSFVVDSCNSNGRSNNGSSLISQLLKSSSAAASGPNNGVSTTKEDGLHHHQHHHHHSNNNEDGAGTGLHVLSDESEDEGMEGGGSSPTEAATNLQCKMNGSSGGGSVSDGGPPSPAGRGGDNNNTSVCNNNLNNNNNSGNNNNTDLEIKRARVETIVSSMRSSPCRETSSMAAQVNGCKKRKHYQPQQHDSGLLMHRYPDSSSPPKHRKVEREILRKQLREIQQQLMQMQQRYCELFEAESSDSEVVGSSQSEEDGGGGQAEGVVLHADLAKGDAGLPVDAVVKSESPDEHKTSSNPHTDALDPAHFIDQARRLVSEQEKLALKEAVSSGADSKFSSFGSLARLASSSSVSPLALDVDGLAETLKNELTASLALLIDSILTRFVQRRQSSHHHHNSKPLDISLNKEVLAAATHMLERHSPRTKVIDRGTGAPTNNNNNNNPNNINNSVAPSNIPTPSSVGPPRTHSNGFGSPQPFSSASSDKQPMQSLFAVTSKPPLAMYNHHHHPSSSPPPPHHSHNPYGPGADASGEQNEALSLVVTPKKKRHKVTDTRITPRTVSRLLSQEPDPPKYSPLISSTHPDSPYHPPPLVPVSLPTSVAIPNPSLHQSDVFSAYPYYHHARGGSPAEGLDDDAILHPSANLMHASLLSSAAAAAAAGGHNSPDTLGMGHFKSENGEGSDCNSPDVSFDGSGGPVISFHWRASRTTPISPADSPARGGSGMAVVGHSRLKSSKSAFPANDKVFLDSGHSSTLTPMHLRKAKLMFFYVRYPSSSILKMYFPDIKFNKNNTAQLVKWFSNFREFFYIQMEKYARQAISEGLKNAEDISVNGDSELYRVLNLHYNRNNHIEVPANFRFVVEQTLREFFKSIIGGKDTEQSWKKSIYKVIARLDDNLPEYFKSPNFLEQLE